MTPKEKAEELVQRFSRVIPFQDTYYSEEKMYKMHKKDAKECALICVDEILATQENAWENNIVGWNKVKEEINKL